jgi:nicotinamidase-related amidase
MREWNMHNSAIYPSVIKRVEQRRGGFRVFDRPDYKRTAQVVVITGTASRSAARSAARDAMMLNYKVFFVADGHR